MFEFAQVLHHTPAATACQGSTLHGEAVQQCKERVVACVHVHMCLWRSDINLHVLREVCIAAMQTLRDQEMAFKSSDFDI